MYLHQRRAGGDHTIRRGQVGGPQNGKTYEQTVFSSDAQFGFDECSDGLYFWAGKLCAKHDQHEFSKLLQLSPGFNNADQGEQLPSVEKLAYE